MRLVWLLGSLKVSRESYDEGLQREMWSKALHCYMCLKWGSALAD